MASRIRVGDMVEVIAGADRGKQGRVIGIDGERDRVRVEKVRMQKRHLKPGRKLARTGGILEMEGHIHASNVMLVDPQTQRAFSAMSSRNTSGTCSSSKIASHGHSGSQTPQLMHSSGSMKSWFGNVSLSSPSYW